MLNKKKWYVLRLTQEGAKKWTSIFGFKFQDKDWAIVNTIDTTSTVRDEIRNRDVIFQINASKEEILSIKGLLKNFIVDCKELA